MASASTPCLKTNFPVLSDVYEPKDKLNTSSVFNFLGEKREEIHGKKNETENLES